MPKQTCLQRRAGVRARGGNSGYGQPKGGRKGGLFPSIIINTLIYNIFMMDCGAPTRTRTADLLIDKSVLLILHYSSAKFHYNYACLIKFNEQIKHTSFTTNRAVARQNPV